MGAQDTKFDEGDTVTVYLDGPNTLDEGWKIGTITSIEEKFGDLVIFGDLDNGGEFFIGRDRDGHGKDKIRIISKGPTLEDPVSLGPNSLQGCPMQ